MKMRRDSFAQIYAVHFTGHSIPLSTKLDDKIFVRRRPEVTFDIIVMGNLCGSRRQTTCSIDEEGRVGLAMVDSRLFG